ncbi:TonB-dependent siderophore receptor [Sphingomonas spermidinifaciens]|uniref:TonB-dependent siderophore receptor n=1 Tax=Sphingomonas spermidinifaciens TaxID=1141889 RepID=A0A2A4B1G2_9SPHN|nr:TonB-dependent siderophore receptor [Sphingomonas spermidinifaciens]PCD01578.1 TonB-dependent siderophore receptor [Sphingomonas spermidinifaciens]
MPAPLLLAALTLAAPIEEEPQSAQDIVVTGVRDVTVDDDEYGVRATRSASRLNLSQKDTPQSISVVTRAQIDDFQLRDVNTLLSTTTGINVQQAETDRTYYSARGFDITNFQLDGVGLPFAYGLQNGALDTAAYERVEVLRGANGLLSMTGNPSATINFVRKRPGRALTGSVLLTGGTYDTKRVEGDVTVPLDAAGDVRTRIVGAYQDVGSYLDRYTGKRSVLYGVVEADLTPTTTLSVGYQRQDNRTDGGLWGALPLFTTEGAATDLPRSTSTSAEWTRWNTLDQQIFGDLTQELSGDWSAKLSVLRRAVDEDSRLFYVYGNPGEAANAGLFAFPGAFRGPTRELTLDAYVTGPVKIGGRTHEVVVGVNRGTSRLRQSSSYPPAGAPLPGNSAFDGSIAEPDFPPFVLQADFETKRNSVYGLVRLNPVDPLKIMVGGNYTWIESEGYSYGVDRVYDERRFLPFAGATFELTPTISLYASYAKIFNPQFELSEQLTILPPAEGDNVEAGVKGSWFDNRFYASAAVFRAQQNGIAEAGRFDTTIAQQLYTTIDARSEGIELDLGGQPLAGLNLSGGYTALRVRDPADGEAVRTYVPRHTARLNATYTPPSLPAVTVGAAVQYQSEIERLQRDAVPATDTAPARDAIFTRQGGYALVDLMARWSITPALSLTANVRNLTNVKYITSLYWEQGFYGAPRTASATLGLKF